MASTSRYLSIAPQFLRCATRRKFPFVRAFASSANRWSSTSIEPKIIPVKEDKKNFTPDVNISGKTIISKIFSPDKHSDSKDNEQKEESQNIKPDLLNMVNENQSKGSKIHDIKSKVNTKPCQENGDSVLRNVKSAVEHVLKQIKSETEIEKTIQLSIDGIETHSKYSKDVHRILTTGLQRISILSTNNESSVVNDGNFKQLIEYVETNYKKLSLKELLDCSCSLISLFPEDVAVVELVENELMWKIREADLDLVIELHKCHEAPKTPLRKTVRVHCEGLIKRRMTETKPVHLLYLMKHYSTRKDTKFFYKLEDRVFDLIDHMSVNNYCNIINYSAVRGSRNESLLRLVLFYLNKTYKKRHLQQISSLLFSCGKLAIYDIELFNKLSVDLMKSDLNSSKFTLNILKSASILGWRHEETLSCLLNQLVNEKQELDLVDVENLLFSASSLNYCPEDKAELLQSHCLKLIDTCTKETSRLPWLNIVWSLAVLKKATPELIATVLEPEFIKHLEQGGAEKWQYQSKLLGLNSAAHFDVPDYSGAYLPQDFLSKCEQGKNNAGKKKMCDDISSALQTFAPEDQFCRRNMMTANGNKIDVELCVDNSGLPVEYVNAQESSSEFHRVAVKVLGFHDLTIPGKLLKGPVDMEIRHLGCQGYKVLTITHNEWMNIKTTEKAEYLKHKLKELIL
ncbi:FAST kinase domain-containing protein 4-like [Mytilus californianus]|uniref:FAST kinase domain-containing protein 4-like n=1 Tax=Mytilus californianus TaxID=6549 RepID=UPI00224833A7|nr:FAST kinase domain-containing protein 4-like [Mytilus californianus]